MNLEALTLTIQTKYLKRELLGSKIYRIFMPNAHSVLFMLKRERDTVGLLADLNGGSPALYIPEKLPENPEVPPAFCMLLRKHLEEGRITSIEQCGLDRVLVLEVDKLGASSRIVTEKVIIELAGKNANVILAQDTMIVDCLRHVGVSQNSYRQLLPGREYVLPPLQKGMSITTEAPAKIVEAAQNLQGISFLKAFIGATLGIGKMTAQELFSTACIGTEEKEPEAGKLQVLAANIQQLQDKCLEEEPSVYALIGRTNQVKTILLLEPKVIEAGMTVRSFEGINKAINYAMSIKPIQLPQQERLDRIVAGELQRLRKKLKALEKDLAEAENADEQRIIADSLMASIYLLKKGQTNAAIMNIYDGEQIKVQLSPLLSPVENAQAYYKRYNKYKRAQTEVLFQLEATEELLTYLESVEASLATVGTKVEIEEIRQELVSIGLIKEIGKKKTSSKVSKSAPLHIKINSDTEIYVGKNNKQNDYVTFTVASPRDLWFHTKNIPGSHVVLKTTLPEPREDDIGIAIQLAAYFSKARNGSNVPVDCVQRKFVKKPSGAKPGFVIFTGNKTYYVNPDETLIKRYLK